MHELSLAQSMIEQLAETMEKEASSYHKIERIDLEIGSMSGVDKDSFEFVFPFAAEGTMAEGAKLVFNEVAVAVNCNQCGKTTSPQYPIVACTECSSMDVEITQGRDFRIIQMEVSDV